MFRKSSMNSKDLLLSILLTALIGFTMISGGSSASAAAKTVKQKTFASPEQAVNDLILAFKANDTKGLLALFGKDAKELVFSGDDAEDRRVRERFVKFYEEKNLLEEQTSGRVVLHTGKEGWPFPIPLVKQGNAWRYDTGAGKEEILNRRIGRNELTVIDVMAAYLEAQRDYVGKDRDGDGVLEYAQKIVSDKGKKGGLYWEVKEGEEESPLGPQVAKAAGTGYTQKTRSHQPTPFHGYTYGILKAQGKHAKGGAYSYLVKDNMILGFGLVAWPAAYRVSGVMTFLVNQEGIVYQKDLGRNTQVIAQKMAVFDPDTSWKIALERKSGNK